MAKVNKTKDDQTYDISGFYELEKTKVEDKEVVEYYYLDYKNKVPLGTSTCVTRFEAECIK